MARLPNKSFTARAPQTGAAWPEMPDFSAELSEIDGGRTNAALQRWSGLMRQRVNDNEQQDNGRFRNIQIAISNTNGYLESSWTLEAVAGDVVTGMKLFSSTDPRNGRTVSSVTFRADVFQIFTSTGNKQIFSADADEVRLGDVLTVDLANAKLYIGAGNFGNDDTPFYVDELSNFSLGEKLTFDGSLLTIGNAYIDSDGAIVLGTSNDVLILSAADSTYRIWAGNATAGSATFSVTKEGELFSTAGTIAGFTINTVGLSAGSGTSMIWLYSTPGGIGSSGLVMGHTGDVHGEYWNNGTAALLQLYGSSTVIGFDASASSTGGLLYLRNAGGAATITLNGATGVILGNGGSLTGLTKSQVGLNNVANVDQQDAANITTGTLNNSRLSFSKTGTGDVPIDGYVSVGGVKLATVA